MTSSFFFSTGVHLLFALSVGIIIGIERQVSSRHTHKKYGIRDFALVSLLAFLSSFLNQYHDYIWSLTFIGILLLSLIMFSFEAFFRTPEGKTPGLTTVLTFPIVFLISSISVFHFEFWLIATLVFTALIILELKDTWHGFAETIEKHEFFDFSILIAIALVITPLIPADAVIKIPLYNFHTEHFEFFHQSVATFWKVVIMVSLMSFIAHFITKHIHGKNALLLASFFGGLVSSLATIILFLRNQQGKEIPRQNVFLGYLAASTGSLTKDIVILYGIVDTAFFEKILFPIVSVFMLLAAMTVFAFSKTETQEIKLTNRPLPLSFIIKFSSVFAMVTIGMVLVGYYLGDNAIMVASFLSGMVSSIASLGAIAGSLASTNISPLVAGVSILLALIGSIFAKFLFIARHLGIKSSYSFFFPIVGMIAIGFFGLYLSFGN